MTHFFFFDVCDFVCVCRREPERMFVTLFQICIFIEQARGDLSMCVHLLMCCMCDREIAMWFVFVLICVIN